MSDSDVPISSPVKAVVNKINVVKNEQVYAGDILAILLVGNKPHELLSRATGSVYSVDVKTGQIVAANQKIIGIKLND
ncbi:biotin/lipoyl-binding protein [Oenococcus alcoholitolerans]|uniref:Lipoyl-binding domain-containing protein n=1 Tax=Oenococcus alcoholitolerans TaxID=931074 RepID=A0ABR4XSJ0_9LACO|nr:hypothetical protein Q757_01865 [Oenococcus alcoholitolerans]